MANWVTGHGFLRKLTGLAGTLGMGEKTVKVADGFWNLRGNFRIAYVINIGTQASLVRLGSGSFVFLDSYTLQGAMRRKVMKLTDGGAKVEAILNLHPFHTVHCARMHADFPKAKLYGSARHKRLLPELPWEQVQVEDPALHAMFSDDFDFSVPNGVDYISDNERIHFSSVLAFHKPSKTIHVDDTLMYVKLPFPFRLLTGKPQLRFHPTLSQALTKADNAAVQFRAWAQALARDWEGAENVCAAHTAPQLSTRRRKIDFSGQISDALKRVSKKLAAHEKKYG